MTSYFLYLLHCRSRNGGTWLNFKQTQFNEYVAYVMHKKKHASKYLFIWDNNSIWYRILNIIHRSLIENVLLTPKLIKAFSIKTIGNKTPVQAWCHGRHARYVQAFYVYYSSKYVFFWSCYDMAESLSAIVKKILACNLLAC